MNKAKEKINRTMEKIQAASPQARMRLAIALTCLVTILILFFWVKSVDDAVNIGQPAEFLTIQKPIENDQGMLERLQLRTAQTIVYFQRKFSEKNEISIEL